jgi:antitoxin component YwqK of YwqJK toxin-antitoxin module
MWILSERCNPIKFYYPLMIFPRKSNAADRLGTESQEFLQGVDYTLNYHQNEPDGIQQECYGRILNGPRWYENGHIKFQRCYKNGVEEWRWWYESGKLRNFKVFQDRKLHGEHIHWYRNGQVNIREFYRNGKLEGERKMWYENGNLGSIKFYRDGKSEGKRIFWYRNGLLHIKKVCGRVGEYKLWGMNGRLKICRFYHNRNAYIPLTLTKKTIILESRRQFFVRQSLSVIGSCIIPDLAKIVFG